MHYKTLTAISPGPSGRISLRASLAVKTVEGNEVEIKKEKLPQALEIIVPSARPVKKTGPQKPGSPFIRTSAE